MIFWDIDVLSKIVMFYKTYKGFNKNIDVLLRIPLFNQKYQGFITNIHVLTKIFMCYQKYHPFRRLQLKGVLSIYLSIDR